MSSPLIFVNSARIPPFIVQFLSFWHFVRAQVLRKPQLDVRLVFVRHTGGARLLFKIVRSGRRGGAENARMSVVAVAILRFRFRDGEICSFSWISRLDHLDWKRVDLIQCYGGGGTFGNLLAMFLEMIH